MKALHRLGITSEAKCESVLTSFELAFATAASRWALNQPSGSARTCSARLEIIESQITYTLTR